MGLDYKIYGCDTTPNLIQDVIDGKVEIISAGANTGAGFAETLINKLLGHPILMQMAKLRIQKTLHYSTVILPTVRNSRNSGMSARRTL